MWVVGKPLRFGAFAGFPWLQPAGMLSMERWQQRNDKPSSTANMLSSQVSVRMRMSKYFQRNAERE